jgi:hypothetical protein
VKKFSPFSAALLFLLTCLSVPQTASPTLEPIPLTPLSTDGANFENGLAPEYQNIPGELPFASHYELEIEIAEDLYHITGRETITYINSEGSALDEIQLRLFSNTLGGEMQVDNVAVNNEPAKTSLSLNGSLLIVSLSNPLQPKEKAVISMDFNVTVPQTVDLNYGVQAFYDNVLALAHAYPMIAVFDDEGWNAEIPPQAGDVTYADMSFFIVKVTAPKDVILVGSGHEIHSQDNGGRQTVTYEAGPVRDFYLAASPDYQVVIKEANGITYRFYTKEGLLAGAEYALDVAANAVEVFERRYAPYPYTELDFVSTPTLALGIEYPGMIAITDWIIEPGEDYLEATVAHEVGHQWFYNLVGNDQLDDPWLDESLTQFATLQYFIDMYGEEGASGFRASLEGRWAGIENEEIPISLPVQDYADREYSGIVYGRGPLFFVALRERMGEAKFDAFLKEYTQANAWKISTPELLREKAEKNCACDLTDIFEEWVYP